MKEEYKRSISGVLLILLYPFAGIIYTFRNIQKQEAEKWFFLICLYFGLAFIYFNPYGLLGEGSDSERYAIALREAFSMRGITLHDYLNYRLREDYYANILLFAVSRFTSNPQIFYGVAAAIMGLFFSKTAWIIINQTKGNKYVWIFIVTMLLCDPIWKINGVRWWTALYVFLYGAFSFVFEKKKIKLIWCLLSVLIHYTFLFPLYILVVYFFLPKKNTLPYVILFMVLTLVSNFDLSSVSDVVAKLIPASFNEETITGYLSFEYKAQHNLFADSGRFVAMYVNLFLMWVAYFGGRKEFEFNPGLKKFFIFTLLMSSLCLFINFAPWGRRFLGLSNFLSFAFYCLFLSQDFVNGKILKNIKFAIPFVAYFAIYQISFGLYSIGAKNLFLGNFLTVFFYNDFISIHHYLELLF